MNQVVTNFKPDPITKNRKYLGLVKQLPCCICDAHGIEIPHGLIIPEGFTLATPPSIAHHWIMGRVQQVKTPDIEAIPMCDGHHKQELWHSSLYTAMGVYGVHTHPAEFNRRYGLDRDYVAATQDTIERAFGYRGE